MDSDAPWHLGELLAFDLETTGIDRFTDVPVSFAFVRMVGGAVESSRAALVDPGRSIPPSATAVHGITDALVGRDGMPLATAIAVVMRVLLDASSRGVPLVGMKLDFDLTMVDACSRRHVGYGLSDAGFRGPVLDALVLDRHFDRFRRGRRTLSDLCAHYGVAIDRAHDAVADASATLGVLTAMCRIFPELCAAEPPELHRAQIGWHREWSTSNAEWRLCQGMRWVDEDEGAWPIAEGAPISEGLTRVAG